MKVETNLFGDKDITMPVRCILANEEKTKIMFWQRKPLKLCQAITIEQTKGNVWGISTTCWRRVRVNLGTGVAKFRVSLTSGT